MASLINEHQQWFDSQTGELLTNGLVYIGTRNLDPQVLANQITIYSDRELTTPIANPQTTNSNGQTANKIWIKGQYSIAVTNSALVQKYQELDNGTDTTIDNIKVDNMTALIAVDTTINQFATPLGFHSSGDGGGGVFYYDSTSLRSEHNGLTIIDPTRTIGVWDASEQTAWFATSASTDLGCWKRSYTGAINFAWGGVTSDGVDQTVLLVIILDSLSETNRGSYELNELTSFDRKSIVAAIPPSVTIIDNSGYDYNSSGETTKKYGIMDFGSNNGSFEMHYSIESGHHAVLETNNYGNSGSTSADERKQSWLYSVGNFTTQGENKRGYRGAAIQQFTKSTGTTFWTWGLRSLAPWAAIDAEYELWKTGEAVTIGDFRYTGPYHYQATTTGTTGSTIPSHTTGSVSDGGVTWLYTDNADRSIIQVDQYNRMLMGTGSFAETFRHKVNETDPNGGSYVMDLVSTGVSKHSLFKLTPTNSSSVETSVPYLQAQADTGLRIMKSDGASDLGAFTEDGLLLRENRKVFTTSIDDSTPTTSDVAVLYLVPTGALTVTALDDGSDGQIVEVIVGNALVTFSNSSTLLLTGSANVTTPAAFSTITFMKVPASISDRWIEISRSIK